MPNTILHFGPGAATASGAKAKLGFVEFHVDLMLVGGEGGQERTSRMLAATAVPRTPRPAKTQPRGSSHL